MSPRSSLNPWKPTLPSSTTVSMSPRSSRQKVLRMALELLNVCRAVLRLTLVVLTGEVGPAALRGPAPCHGWTMGPLRTTDTAARRPTNAVWGPAIACGRLTVVSIALPTASGLRSSTGLAMLTGSAVFTGRSHFAVRRRACGATTRRKRRCHYALPTCAGPTARMRHVQVMALMRHRPGRRATEPLAHDLRAARTLAPMLPLVAPSCLTEVDQGS